MSPQVDFAICITFPPQYKVPTFTLSFMNYLFPSFTVNDFQMQKLPYKLLIQVTNKSEPPHLFSSSIILLFSQKSWVFRKTYIFVEINKYRAHKSLLQKCIYLEKYSTKTKIRYLNFFTFILYKLPYLLIGGTTCISYVT